MYTLGRWDLQCFHTFRNCCIFSTFGIIRKFYSGDASHANYGNHSLKSSFPTLRTLCIWHLQYLQSSRNGCLFCTLWLIRNFYSGEAHDANYSKHSLNHHFQHCAHSVYQILRIFKVLKIAVCRAHFSFYEISTREMRNMLTMANSLNHHFLHCANCVYEIYSIFKVFEIAVCFAHFVAFEIWTPLILTRLAMVKVVQIIISNIAHSMYMRFTVFSKFSKLLFVLHISAYSKFLLRSWATCKLWQA